MSRSTSDHATGSRENRRPRIGLALSGGAARAFAHLGVLRVLSEHNISFDFIAGTSAGAIVGAALAAGLSVAEIEEISRNMRWRDAGRMTLSRLGIQSNAPLEAWLRKHLPVTRFEDLPVPFAAVATDLHAGTAVMLHGTGDIPFAVRASCALPGWYVPVTDEAGRQLVDGGLVANVPSKAVRELGADKVIAVDLNADGAKFLSSPRTALGVLLQSIMVVQRTASSHQWQAADVIIRPKIGHIRWDEINRADELYAAGEAAARASIEEIKQLLAPAIPTPAPKWYQLRRRKAFRAEENQNRLHTTTSR
ncbi:MAG: patatin-like phospholipase family protein [Pyrinomonadaceae bacterium]